MDLAAVQNAPAAALALGADAAARNACGLVEDAELLFRGGRRARAYSLAGLAVEEVGKADCLAAVAAMPEDLRVRAPIGRMVGWHQMKLVAGHLTAAVKFRACDKTSALAIMPLSQVADVLDRAQALAEKADRLKQRGLYVDVDRRGRVREPSEVTAAEVREQLDQARQAASAASASLDPGAAQRFADAGPAGLELTYALVSAFVEIGASRSPEAAADVFRNAVTKVRG